MELVSSKSYNAVILFKKQRWNVCDQTQQQDDQIGLCKVLVQAGEPFFLNFF